MYSRKLISILCIASVLIALQVATAQTRKRLIPFPGWSLDKTDNDVSLELVEIKIAGKPIAMDFSHIPESKRPSVHGMILLCEFWLEADGDQLAFDQKGPSDDCSIVYYSHEHAGVTKVAESFDGLLSWWAKGPKAWQGTLRS